MKPRFVSNILSAWLFAGAAVSAAPGGTPSPAESAILARLKGRIVGQIIWESNRNGKWQLFTMNADGTGARPLTDGTVDCTGATLSGDGNRVLFTRRVSPVRTQVWMMRNDGTEARELVDDGFSPEWRKGDEAIQFLRRRAPRDDHSETWEYDLRTGGERRLFPPAGVTYTPEVWGGTGNDEATRFVIWSPRPRGTWVVSADGRVQAHVHGGCEGRISPDQKFGYGVKTPGQFIRFDLSDGGHPVIFNKRTGPWSHTYFPCVSRDARWLVFGACPPNQHNHDTSDYEIFLTRLVNWTTPEPAVRLTFNSRTDRWPTIYVAPAGASNPLPVGPYDVAANKSTNPPPLPLALDTFAAKDALPDFGGRAGIWPTNGTCRATVTFVPRDNPPGGRGGSVRIDYHLEGAPHSVAYWLSPVDEPLDLSAYDRFTVWAKGGVSSFTLVVEDANADHAGGDKGVADCRITGVSEKWKRFELPFDRFRPRRKNGRLDWGRVRIVAVALIAPKQPNDGWLQVDELFASAGPGKTKR